MNELLIFAVAGMVMWSLRASAIVLAGERTWPESTTRAFAYARHAVLAALIAAAVTHGTGPAALVLPSPPLLGVVAAGAVAWRTGGMLRTLATGVAVVAIASAASM